MKTRESYLKIFSRLLVLASVCCFGGGTVQASEVFSCKPVSRTTLSSDRSDGWSLYGDSDIGRSMMSREKTEILIVEHKKQITFGGEVYKHLKGSSGISGQFYEHGYWGLIEVYDKRKSEVTLFTSRSNGNNSQMSNRLEVRLYHCNK